MITFEELAKDKEFLQGLHSGEFCLVLGAGFSFGLKNKTNPGDLKNFKCIPYSQFSNIPLASDYVSLTNAIFCVKLSKYQAAADTWLNYNFKLKISDSEELELKPFIKSLFSVDENWFKENSLKLFKNILIPQWHHIYTFNFDNVIETIIKQTSKENVYYSVYPPKTGLEKTSKTAVVHLHGYILETELEKLTFDTINYGIERGAEHTLYDPFYFDVNSSKKLFIIGSQFDEEIIDDKFFKGLEYKQIHIYHFSRSNDDFASKPFIHNNPNYHFIKIKDTRDVLGFIEKYKTQIENININGAEVITDVFKKEVINKGEERKFTPIDFYLAKKDDDCKWYGLIKRWDVERKVYRQIKTEVITSINEYHLAKISALVYGRGGCGKSTLLRRLALDLANEDFAILWIKDNEISKFYESGLRQLIENYPHKKFLILIEDLYRIKQQTVNIKEIINNICSHQNIQLVVGDRAIDISSYGEHIHNPDKNKYELSVNDNKQTLDDILENIPEWKETASTLLIGENDYQSSLYFILWTIGRTVEKNMQTGSSVTSFTDIVSHFRTLVESDLRAIGNHYPGIAQMLYYWASIYEKNKSYISFDLFFKLADLFKKTSDDDSKLALATTGIKAILDIYIHKAQGFIKSAGELPLVAFNHDILAEDGLSKVKLFGWQPFDDSIKLKMLPEVVEKGDNFSASIFLLYCLRTIKENKFEKEEKRKWIEKLLAKKIFDVYLIPVFSGNFYDGKQKTEIASDILSQTEFWKLPEQIVSMAMKISGNKEVIKKAAVDILSQVMFWKLPEQIVCMAMNISGNNELREKTASNILSQTEFWKFSEQIVSTAMNISGNKELIEKAAADILSQTEFWKLPYQIVSTAMKILGNKVLKEKAATDILSQTEFWKLPHPIVSTAMKILENKGLKEKAANKILELNDWKRYNSIIFSSLYTFHDKTEIPSYVINIVREIINDYLDKNYIEKGKYFRYKNLMRIPFHSIPEWKKSSKINIFEWKTKRADLLTNTILGYYTKPEEIKTMCSGILINWENEIVKKIPLNKSNIHYGDHIKFSLGHPELKVLAEQIAIQMKFAEIKIPGIIPAYLMEIVNQIIDEKKFPEWDIEVNNIDASVMSS
jgi:hypothetical protein